MILRARLEEALDRLHLQGERASRRNLPLNEALVGNLQKLATMPRMRFAYPKLFAS